MEDKAKFIQLFEDISKGLSKYTTLDSLQVDVPYEVVGFRPHESPYGRCIIAVLVDGFWLVLPKRIGDTVKTEEHLNIINSQKYWMIFKGRHPQYRRMALLEFKTMDKFLPQQLPQPPTIDFVINEALDIVPTVKINEQWALGEREVEVLPTTEEIAKAGQTQSVSAKIKIKKDRK